MIRRGDCLDVMASMDAGSVDLIYLDPPFNSGRDYKAASGAFSDKFGSTAEYVHFITERLIACKRIMSERASIYVHVDVSACHRVRVAMDGVFGERSFRNEIVWCYYGPSTPNARQFPRKHDTIYWYSVGDKWTFNPVRVPYKKPKQMPIKRMVGNKDDFSKEAIDEMRKRGKIIESHWNDICIVVRSKNENKGYPTQKPLALLERIISASSNPGDLVFDPFMGSGTTLVAAKRLGRRYAGCDISQDAVNVTRERLERELV